MPEIWVISRPIAEAWWMVKSLSILSQSMVRRILLERGLIIHAEPDDGGRPEKCRFPYFSGRHWTEC